MASQDVTGRINIIQSLFFPGSSGWENKLHRSQKLSKKDISSFAEYLCNHSPKRSTKNFKDYISVLAILNYQNWHRVYKQ